MQGTSSDLHEDTLDQTIAALEGDPTTFNPDTILAIVDQWHGAVLGEDDLDLGDVAAGLEELHDLLAADAFDGEAIGAVLLRLGEAVEVAARQAGDERLTPRLEHLATLLTYNGNLLSGSNGATAPGS